MDEFGVHKVEELDFGVKPVARSTSDKDGTYSIGKSEGVTENVIPGSLEEGSSGFCFAMCFSNVYIQGIVQY